MPANELNFQPRKPPVKLNMDGIAIGLAQVCRGHRLKCGVKADPHSDDCVRLQCQINCPIAVMNAKDANWWKEEMKLRRNEERAVQRKDKEFFK